MAFFVKVYSRFSRNGKMASFTSQTSPLRRETSQQRLAVPDVCRRRILSSLKSSKSNNRVRLNVNMNIADSISFYFNFGKSHYFLLMVKQHIFGKARIFQMNRVNPRTINWREKKSRNLRSPFAIIWKLSRQNKISLAPNW